MVKWLNQLRLGWLVLRYTGRWPEFDTVSITGGGDAFSHEPDVMLRILFTSSNHFSGFILTDGDLQCWSGDYYQIRHYTYVLLVDMSRGGHLHPDEDKWRKKISEANVKSSATVSDLARALRFYGHLHSPPSRTAVTHLARSVNPKPAASH